MNNISLNFYQNARLHLFGSFSNDLKKLLPGSRVFSPVRHHARDARRIKNRELLLPYTISEIFADGGEGRDRPGTRQQLESRERCYQRDEETKRSLRIIESYDCLFRASLLQLPRVQRRLACIS